ncbi:MAG: polysaccharide deacetylase family protein [Tabrizicola sp.]|nr:polysaccharide deacetylase family protein [Tabrizicola sp.]
MNIFLAVLSGAVFLALAWFGAGVLHRRLVTARLAARCAERRAIVLSYDDGPSDRVTPALQDLLRQHEVKATFFAIGAEAKAQPAVLAGLLADGHEIGSHTENHGNAWKSAPVGAIRDLSAGQATLSALGVRTVLFRPPFGKSTLGTLLAGLGRGMRFAFWTVDSRDSWAPRGIDDILREIGDKNGGVVLMHDFNRARRGPRPEAHATYVLELTAALIGFARREGFTLMRFGDLTAPATALPGGKA